VLPLTLAVMFRRVAGNAGDDAQDAGGRIEAVSEPGAGRTGNAGEVAGVGAGYIKQLETYRLSSAVSHLRWRWLTDRMPP